MPHPAPPPREPLCLTCRHRVLNRYLLAGKPAESFDCRHHYQGRFPNAEHCDSYEREPGSDDA